MNNTSAATFVIWDIPKPPPSSYSNVFLWRAFSFESVPHAVSIPLLIEKNAQFLRSHYLSLVYEFGHYKVDGTPLVGLFHLRAGLSVWWLSLIAEKSNCGKSPQIDDVLRMLAFIDWIGNSPPSRLILVSKNSDLATSFRAWSSQVGIIFEWQTVRQSLFAISFNVTLSSIVPLPLKALISFFIYLFRRRHFFGLNLDSWRNSSADISFVSYLANLSRDATKLGKFASNYWGDLPEIISSHRQHTNWIHLYVKDNFLTNEKVAVQVLDSFNQDTESPQLHLTLDSFLSVSLFFEILRSWISVALRAYGVKRKIILSRTKYAYILPLLASDWDKSFFGATSIFNIFYYYLFEEALRILPHQKLGFYLQENQGWEKALIHAWNVSGHGQLVGVPHATVRYWDLRYFSDLRAYDRTPKYPMPMPDKVALNGTASTNSYLLGLYPRDQLVQVEALRYHHLLKSCTGSTSSHHLGQAFTLLILGDYLVHNTIYQLSLLQQALSSVQFDLNILLKPHPLCALNLKGLRLDLTVVSDKLENLLAFSDAAYVGPETSAALDAYFCGIPVISVLDPSQLNRNPLRDFSDVYFVYKPIHILNALNSISSCRTLDTHFPHEYFNLDTNYPLWRCLLQLPPT